MFYEQTSNSSTAELLWSGFLTRHFDTKSMNSGVHLSGFLNEGGGFVGIINIAWNKKQFYYTDT